MIDFRGFDALKSIIISEKVFENSFLYEVRTLSGVSLLARIACGCVLRRAF
jgi:hypothetical protein